MVLASFVIVFRETLEAALIIGIILAYLYRMKQYTFQKYVWLGAASGIVASVILAIILRMALNTLDDSFLKIFEVCILGFICVQVLQ